MIRFFFSFCLAVISHYRNVVCLSGYKTNQLKKGYFYQLVFQACNKMSFFADKSWAIFYFQISFLLFFLANKHSVTLQEYVLCYMGIESSTSVAWIYVNVRLSVIILQGNVCSENKYKRVFIGVYITGKLFPNATNMIAHWLLETEVSTFFHSPFLWIRNLLEPRNVRELRNKNLKLIYKSCLT